MPSTQTWSVAQCSFGGLEEGRGQPRPLDSWTAAPRSGIQGKIPWTQVQDHRGFSPCLLESGMPPFPAFVLTHLCLGLFLPLRRLRMEEGVGKERSASPPRARGSGTFPLPGPSDPRITEFSLPHCAQAT